MPKFLYKIVILMSLFLVSCTAQQHISREYENPSLFTKPHRILTGEQIQVTVYGQANLSKNYRVDDRGNISFPLLGIISSHDKTPNQLADNIAYLLSQKYIKNPNVTVEMVTYTPIFITGAVKNVGQFTFVPGITAEAAIAGAGGFLQSANKTVVKITRRNGNVIQEHNVALQTPLAAGDIVRVYGNLFSSE
ncbi:MAG: polysaccharide biosynthesis/export family protein [Rhizobiales bacterium]|nr:polysaccharide biosynthesis/export family protein [Hyphomicrobiales bacterium]